MKGRLAGGRETERAGGLGGLGGVLQEAGATKDAEGVREREGCLEVAPSGAGIFEGPALF